MLNSIQCKNYGVPS